MSLLLMFAADQTPTPSKFLRNCEEMGLFHELSKNPFEEAFKKASEDSKNLELNEVSVSVCITTSDFDIVCDEPAHPRRHQGDQPTHVAVSVTSLSTSLSG